MARAVGVAVLIPCARENKLPWRFRLWVLPACAKLSRQRLYIWWTPAPVRRIRAPVALDPPPDLIEWLARKADSVTEDPSGEITVIR